MSENNDAKPMSLGERIRMVRGKLSQAKFGWLISKHKDAVLPPINSGSRYGLYVIG